MADYRLYCLDGAGQIAAAPKVVTADSDAEAVAAARALAEPMACELWLANRLIARIPAAERD